MVSEEVQIRTAAGTADALLTRPDTSEKLPGVLQLTDGLGLRPAHAELSARIAQHGYVVLTPNIFYRTNKVPVFTGEVDFMSEATQKRFREITSPLTPEAMAADGISYLDYLSAQPSVRRGAMGVVGFCFAGQFALRTAAARPDQVAAAASFHGGMLVVDGEKSPHLVIPKIKARLYFGHAVNDRSMSLEAIKTLESALEAWGGTWQSEIYDGAMHGWMIPGGRAYHAEHAERGFIKLMELLDGTLKVPAGV